MIFTNRLTTLSLFAFATLSITACGKFSALELNSPRLQNLGTNPTAPKAQAVNANAKTLTLTSRICKSTGTDASLLALLKKINPDMNSFSMETTYLVDGNHITETTKLTKAGAEGVTPISSTSQVSSDVIITTSATGLEAVQATVTSVKSGEPIGGFAFSSSQKAGDKFEFTQSESKGILTISALSNGECETAGDTVVSTYK